MNYLKTNPVGVDHYIQQLQTAMYAELKDAWGLTDATYDCYGRVYRNETDDGYIPEAYIGNKEYRELLYNDKVAAQSFFSVIKEPKPNEAQYTTPVALIFCVDLSKLNQSTDREDELIRNTVEAFVSQTGNFLVNQVVFDSIANVFKDYSGKRIQAAKFSNMHPKHCFRIDMTVTYNLNPICIKPITYLN